MPTLKYFAAIEAAQAQTRREGVDLADSFDLSALGSDTWFSRLQHAAFDLALKAGFYLLRKYWPVAKFGRLFVVSRAADVRKILTDPEHFGVPFGPEMTELAGGEDFVLGLDDEGHAWQRAVLKDVMRRDDIAALRTSARKTAEALVANSRGRIDVMKDMYCRVSGEVCLSYFGLTAQDPDAFADWTHSISALLFADPFGSPETRALALKGAAGVRGVIDVALARMPEEPSTETLLGRLKRRQKSEPELTDAKIKSILVGTATGLVPTTTLCAGRIVQELFRRPEQLRRAIALATAGNLDELQTLLFEAARLNPALVPGLWRYVRKAISFVDSRGKSVAIPEGAVVVAGTASALVDSAEIPEPYLFKTNRPASSFDLLFGTFMHECLGKWLSMALITEITAVFLRLPGMEAAPGRDGRMGWIGAYPRRFEVVFDLAAAPAGFAMVTVAAPLATAADANQVKAALEALGNPAPDPVKTAIERAGTIHFVAASVLEFGDADKPSPHLVIEINADGNDDQAIAATAEALGPTLGPIVATATKSRTSFKETMHHYKLDLQTRPFGAIGLNFPGLGEFSVRDIDRQSRLAEFAQEAVSFYLQAHLGRGARALDALEFVRGLIRPNPAMATETSGKLAELALRGREFVDDLLLPSRRRLALMDWTEPSLGAVAWAIVKDPSDLTSIKVAVALVLALSVYLGFRILPWPHAKLFQFEGLLWLLVAAGAVVIGVLITILLIGVVSALALVCLRSLEVSDEPDNREPSLAKIRAAAAVEDAPGHAQNHFTSVSDLKPGFFRKMTLAASLWGIKEVVTRLYRPGFVLNLGTINFARWFRPPGAQKLVFFSNFDGSWHSYLEDFITKAHAGQSAAWSNGVGFPRTRYLVLDGARDGDSFKRWVRRQQVVTQFWSPRFPGLAANIKRANAIIHFGLARAADETQARDWLSQFGSVARATDVVETDEAQALVFRGFRDLPEGEFVALRFPDDRKRLQAWLGALTTASDRAEDSGFALSFGDYPSDEHDPESTAAFVAFSPSGLLKAGFPVGDDGEPSTEFPSAFNLGMASRSRVLGDLDGSQPKNWRWSDSADAMLIVLGKTREGTTQCVARHLDALGPNAALHRVPSTPTPKGIGYEPFGFKDGISQPIIKGTRRHAKGAPDRDLLEAGEFVLGYRNSAGYYAPSPSLPAQYDLHDRLPTKETKARTSVPILDGSTAMRDFGRNGSFLAVRQLSQDVGGFEAQSERLLAGLERKADIESAIGDPVTKERIQAKMLGRWQSGAPLVSRDGKLPPDERPDNDFDFASDDAEGFRCPVGAHIRRANPRASLGHGDADSQTIVNRHRLIRRGRPYRYTAPSGADEQGLMFVAVCADVERQFEFVQQSWLNAPAFEDLRNEPDPIVGSTEGLGAARDYTIPTAFGPVRYSGLKSFVEVEGGGYFFLPSRSALLFLADAVGSRAV